MALNADSLVIEVSGVEVTHLAAAGAPPGVKVLLAAGRNGPGTGYILTNATGNGLQWKAPGSETYGAVVSTASNGTYRLLDGQDTDKFVRVQVYASYLVANTWSEVELRDVMENGVAGDDVTAEEAAAGDVSTIALTLRNVAATLMLDLKAWIDSATSGIEISDDNATWVSPTTEGTALAFGITASGGTQILYVRRTIGAGSASDEEVLSHLRFMYTF